MIRRLLEAIKRLFGLGEDNDYLDDDDSYDAGMLMAYIKPGEKLDTTY